MMLHARPEIKTVAIAPDGNLILELPKNTTIFQFRVSSSALCLASPVLRAMLRRNFGDLRATIESDQEPYKLDIEGDDPVALFVVLHILHLRSDKVPHTISFENMDDLAAVAVWCDKYDCYSALEP
jgi:hypothetical protein